MYSKHNKSGSFPISGTFSTENDVVHRLRHNIFASFNSIQKSNPAKSITPNQHAHSMNSLQQERKHAQAIPGCANRPLAKLANFPQHDACMLCAHFSVHTLTEDFSSPKGYNFDFCRLEGKHDLLGLHTGICTMNPRNCFNKHVSFFLLL